MGMDHFWPIPASFQLSISLFIVLPVFLLPFGVFKKNMHGILFTWFAICI
jgi:hypothetical protein